MDAYATVWTVNWGALDRIPLYTKVVANRKPGVLEIRCFRICWFYLAKLSVPLFGPQVEIISHPCFRWNAAEGNV
jgi:hypothetical protein